MQNGLAMRRWVGNHEECEAHIGIVVNLVPFTCR